MHLPVASLHKQETASYADTCVLIETSGSLDKQGVNHQMAPARGYGRIHGFQRKRLRLPDHTSYCWTSIRCLSPPSGFEPIDPRTLFSMGSCISAYHLAHLDDSVHVELMREKRRMNMAEESASGYSSSTAETEASIDQVAESYRRKGRYTKTRRTKRGELDRTTRNGVPYRY